jgi:hypothetical protein
VCRCLDRFGILILRRLLQSREAHWGIFHECVEQSSNHLLDAGLAQLGAKALDIHVRRRLRSY